MSAPVLGGPPVTDLAALPSAAPGSAGELERLTSLLDPAFLRAIGWDAEAQVLTPAPGHPQLGWQVCLVAGCQTEGRGVNGLCAACTTHWRTSGLALETFVAQGPRKQRSVAGESLCAVVGCARPWVSAKVALCCAHEAQRANQLGVSLQAFLAHPAVRPRPSFGCCQVACCPRVAEGRRRLCRPHDARWRLVRRQQPDADLKAWCRTARPVANGRTAVLRGLPALLQAQLLYGLQERTKHGYKTRLEVIRGLCQRLRDAEARSIIDIALGVLDDLAACQELAAGIRTAVVRAFSSPELEQHKDIWDMAVFGHGGNQTVNFTKLSQGWLRQGAKHWVAEELPTRRGDVAGVMRDHVNCLAELSASLRLHRDDHGEDPAALSRDDVVAFLNRLAHLEAAGQMSANHRRVVCLQAAKVLRDCRARGLTRLGQPLAGLPDDFTLRPEDAPPPVERAEAGRALPQEVLRQLTDRLPQLEARSGREARVAIQLLIDTGRRPDEICALPWDCLDHDAEGKYTLIYTDFKNNRTGRRLAIADQTARLIIEQQQHVRCRFPNTPVGKLALLPRRKGNPHGAHPVKDTSIGDAHRRWVTVLPPLLTKDGTEFDKTAVVPYVYRHSYAQRHADAGVSVDELRVLMGHRSMTTTQLYYRVTAKRVRAAVDRLAAFQFDGHGNRVWREARALLEHEHQRRAVGQVAVPFGICTEPSNVKAGGHACPFRFRCVGCGHFRSDPSYLPELRGYLDMLLRNRERVRAAVELEEWARAEAMPSDAEIGRVRALIRRAETDLEQLSDEERQQVEEAIQVVGRTRQVVHLGMPNIRPPDLDPTLDTNREDLA